MKTGTLRDFMCECHRARCRERIYLSCGTYKRLSKEGRVVARGHESPSVVLHLTRDAAVVL